MKRLVAPLLISLLLAACSGLDVRENTDIKDGGDPSGSFLTGKDEQGIVISDLGNAAGESGPAALPVNALLWRASLDIASFVPLKDVDTFGGSIVTEWYSLESRPNERIKLAIFVLDRELRSDGLRVLVYIQKKTDDGWADAGRDLDMARKIEELILTRAREIRAAAQVESEG